MREGKPGGLHLLIFQIFTDMGTIRQAKLARADMPYNQSDVFDASTSDVNIPLTPRAAAHAERGELYPFSQPYQYGSHSGAGPTSVIYAPTPKTPNSEYKPTNNYGYSKSSEYLDDASSSGHSSHTHMMSRPSVDDVSWDTGRYAPPGISTPPPNMPLHSPQIPPQDVHLPASPLYLPASPHLPSPYDVRHVGEPTGASYHTAVGREASEASTVMDIPGEFDAGRVRSPPPPSYTATAR